MAGILPAMARLLSHTPVAAALTAALALCLATPQAHAWGELGHRVVGHLAEARLSPAARAEVARLLAGEAEPTLAGVANWADRLRDTPPADDPELGRRTSTWHYVNLAEDGCHYDAARDCPDGNCVVGAIERQVAILRDRTQPTEARARALKFVVHFVGDVHQPLHAGYARDKGGNDFQVQFGGEGSNLHRVWDSGLLRASGHTEDDLVSQLRARAARVAQATPAAWAEASCRVVVQDGFYPARRTLDAAYSQAWMPTARTQLHAAGWRLAEVLESALR